MNLYTKDYLLDGKIIYFQPKDGYRSGIEPIILASKAKASDLNILDLGAGCGPISLIVAYRFPKSRIVGIEKNNIHYNLALRNKEENNFINLEYFNKDISQFYSQFDNYFDLILTNPPFFFENTVIKSSNLSIRDAKYITKKKLDLWFHSLFKYLSPLGKAYIINRYENLGYMRSFFSKMLCEMTITPLLSFKGSKPKNVLISIKKNEKYVEKIENDFIIHTNSSEYSKDIKNWFK